MLCCCVEQKYNMELHCCPQNLNKQITGDVCVPYGSHSVSNIGGLAFPVIMHQSLHLENSSILQFSFVMDKSIWIHCCLQMSNLFYVYYTTYIVLKGSEIFTS